MTDESMVSRPATSSPGPLSSSPASSIRRGGTSACTPGTSIAASTRPSRSWRPCGSSCSAVRRATCASCCRTRAGSDGRESPDRPPAAPASRAAVHIRRPSRARTRASVTTSSWSTRASIFGPRRGRRRARRSSRGATRWCWPAVHRSLGPVGAVDGISAPAAVSAVDRPCPVRGAMTMRRLLPALLTAALSTALQRRSTRR